MIPKKSIYLFFPPTIKLIVERKNKKKKLNRVKRRWREDDERVNVGKKESNKE